MKRLAAALATVLMLSLFALGQQPQTPAVAPSMRSDLYHVHFVKAAPGKTRELLESLKTPAPNAPMPGHVLLLRHLQGDEWDFVAIEHLGTRAMIEATGGPTPARELRAWHNDTYATGPAWADFVKAMGMTATPGAQDKSVYIVSTYRGAPGHRAQLEQSLNRVTAASRRPGESILLQHSEGSPWDYLYISHFNSWQDFAAQQDDPEAEGRERRAGFTQSPGLELREHMAAHHDTITDRIPLPAAPAQPPR
ncbi:MAG TPA: hypothetical protein VN622_07265 [Clostridia bacterium]|nr:hypothetical protein [Clostridia bacterium]